MGNLNGKVIIVTGALGGIGRASARLMAEAGGTVVITDIVDAGGVEFADELSSVGGGGASFIAADLTDESQVEGLVAHALDTFGGLHGAFNNAGIAQKVGPLIDYSSEDFEHILRVNTVSIFHCLKHEMRAMPTGGSIVNTSSATAATAVLNAAAYIASKHAVCGTRAAAVEGGPQNIRVNAILPGATLTQQQIDAHGAEASQSRAAQVHLLGRAAQPVEVGNMARWLISDESSFVTGGLYPVDGGASAGRRV